MKAKVINPLTGAEVEEEALVDTRAAERAGGISIIVDRHHPTRLDFHADYAVRSLTEIPDLVEHLKGDGDQSK